jgi:hypothetical protein
MLKFCQVEFDFLLRFAKEFRFSFADFSEFHLRSKNAVTSAIAAF